MYCTYLTIYFGNKLPRRYIGSSSVESIMNGYNGSVSSRKWKEIYEYEQTHNKHLFKTRILTIHTDRIEAIEAEKKLHIKYDVVSSSKYFNESIAIPNGFFGRDVSGQNNPMFGKSRKGEKHKGGENISAALKKLYETEKGLELKQKTSKRLTNNNPSTNPQIMNKIKQTWQNNNRNVGNKNGMFGKEGKLKGKKLYNNGLEVKAFIENMQPAGWVLGRIP